MATRLYFSNAAPAYEPPTERGNWNNTVNAVVRKLGPKAGAAATAIATNTGSNTRTMLGKYISDPFLSGGTFAGTAEWVIGVSENGFTSIDAVTHMMIYVTSGDSDTPRGTLREMDSNIEWNLNTLRGLGEGAWSLTSLACQAGDRIVVEVGTFAANLSSSTRSARMGYGATGATDLTTNSTATSSNPSWIEFSGADALFEAPVGPTKRRGQFAHLFPGGI